MWVILFFYIFVKKIYNMKKLLFVLILLIGGYVYSQEPVYVAGEDEISWVLQSGKGEKILNEYDHVNNEFVEGHTIFGSISNFNKKRLLKKNNIIYDLLN